MTERRSGGAAMIQHRLVTAVRAALLLVALTVQFGLSAAPPVRTYSRVGGSWSEIAGFAVLALVGVGGAYFVLRQKNIPTPIRWSGVALLLAASAIVSAGLPPEPTVRVEHWCFGLIGWYGLVLLFDLSLAAVAAFLGTHLVLAVGEVVLVGAPGPALASMAISAVSVAGAQLGVGMAAGILRGIAVSASASARAEERVRTDEAAAEHMHRDREQRYAELLVTTAPLLAGLATGTLDPAAEDTRRRCAVDAARMRRLFAQGDDVSDHLVHELRAGLDVAERHGVSVQLAVRGEPCPLDTAVRRELLDSVSQVLVLATSGARVTVLRCPERVRMSVVTEVAEPPPAPESRHVRVDRVMSGNVLWMEAVWESVNPSPLR
ncbi:hypothetical protein [Actinokineospora sp.]|uniref:hypothetical protein n=1 Tax=Actinokineospora sp. TaxID=1872133 RepID=UPI0040379CD1